MLDILCACTHPEILEVMDRLVNKQDGWRSSKAENQARVMELLAVREYDLILLGAGFGPEERAVIERQLAERQHHTKIVTHFGGGSGLLYSEVSMALAKHNAINK